jgi:hypothetical protein
LESQIKQTEPWERGYALSMRNLIATGTVTWLLNFAFLTRGRG